ncbi:PHP domain-containing protein [Streptomyces sp. NPDC046994]|uniref:PHP domain-containing protein n=1 Tax=Streptomyces sp. NPDC046994 TaxID=3155735 RepID=UPI0034546351
MRPTVNNDTREGVLPADLHTHTTVSDGRLAPEEVVREAARSGVTTLVITDHAAVTWSPRLRQLARSVGVVLPFPGVEISTVHGGGRRYHVLGYGEGCLDEAFTRWVARTNEAKNERMARALEILRTHDPLVPAMNRVLRGALPDGTELHPGKQLIGRTQTVAVVAATTRRPPEDVRAELVAALAQVDADGPSLSEAERVYLPTVEVIRRMARLGIVPVLAHPLWQHRTPDADRTTFHADLEIFRNAGLLASEVASYHHVTPGVDTALLEFVTELGLKRCGGSDFHGNGKSHLGRYGLTDSEFARIDTMVRARRL